MSNRRLVVPRTRALAIGLGLGLGGWLVPTSGLGAAPATLAAYRCEKCQVTVDAVLDEPLWAEAARGEGFVQWQPHELEPATEPTSVQVAFDDDTLYVAVYAHDAEPSAIRAPLGRRDSEPPSDWIRIFFDSYADRRTAFEFGVNPAGLKVDGILAGDAARDLSWNAVWGVATRRVADGWIAEFRIPLSELRFSSAGANDWGFQVERVVARLNETSLWAKARQSDARFVARFGALLGLRDLRPRASLQLVPYARVGLGPPLRVPSGWQRSRGGPELRLGGDAVGRVSGNFTLNATVNPDFGQVEADPSLVNLTAYEPYFVEQRPFFVEGNEILKYGLGIGDGDLSRDTLFYSRRIGGLYGYEPATSGNDVLTMPSSANIFGAAKLSGKTSGGTSLAVLETTSQRAVATVTSPADDVRASADGHALVAPLTNYFVARAQQDWRDGRASVGAIATSVVRDLASSSSLPLVQKASTLGLDLTARSMNDEWVGSASLAASDVRGTSTAVTAVQEAAARYFQRPGNGAAHLDPERTSLQGLAAATTLGKVGGEPWRYALFGLMRTPGFEANDLGFVSRADWAFGVLWAGYRDFQPGAWFREIALNVNWLYGASMAGLRTDLGLDLNGNLKLLNYWLVYFGADLNPPVYDVTALRGGPALVTPTHYSAWAGVTTDNRRPASIDVWAAAGYDAHDAGLDSGFTLALRPSTRLNVSVQLTYTYRDRDRQYVDTIVDAAGTHYVLGHLRQDSVVVVTRLDFTVTPELTVQLYAQPFLSAGAYDRYREVIDGRAAAYEDRFAAFDSYPLDTGPADFNFKQYRATLVARWEYSPGSVLFAVWSQDRTNEVGSGRVHLSDDLTRLLGTRGNDVLLVKLSYWLGV